MNKLLPAFVLLLCAVAATGQAQDAAPAGGSHHDQERARIASERKAVDAVYASQEAACYKKFTVNDCLKAAKVQRRTSMSDLRRQEIALNDAERKRKGADQMQRADDKASVQTQQSAAERRAKAQTELADKQQKARDTAERSAAAKAAEAAKQGEFSEKQKNAPAAQAGKSASAAVEARRYQEKMREAEEHRAARERKRSEQTKAPAKPLPAPEP